jgi:hypothetical protein
MVVVAGSARPLKGLVAWQASSGRARRGMRSRPRPARLRRPCLGARARGLGFVAACVAFSRSCRYASHRRPGGFGSPPGSLGRCRAAEGARTTMRSSGPPGGASMFIDTISAGGRLTRR